MEENLRINKVKSMKVWNKHTSAQVVIRTCRCISVCVLVGSLLLSCFPRNVLDRQREADAFLSSQRRLQHMWRVARLVILNTPCAPCM